MPVDAERIQRDIETIARFTHSPGNGASRPTFSEAWREARDYVVREAEAAGCTVRVDAAGNVFARPAGLRTDTRVWLSGSHVDTVPNGGDFDGVAGVVVPLELLRAAREEDRALPLELVIWAEEEGTTFGLGMLGSRAATGVLSADDLARYTNVDGQTYLEAGAPHGVDPERLSTSRLQYESYLALVEVHVEQGPAMWLEDMSLAVVSAINGRRQYQCVVEGTANHAGSTPMKGRRDALVGAAEMIAFMPLLVEQISADAVGTVGRIACHPDAVNVVPGEVAFSVDFRSPDPDVLDQWHDTIRLWIPESARRKDLRARVEDVESAPPVPMDRGVISCLQNAAGRLDLGGLPVRTSGALHDAAILAPHLPSAMLFVASRDGISHNPAEFSRIDDLALAAKVLEEAIRAEAVR